MSRHGCTTLGRVSHTVPSYCQIVSPALMYMCSVTFQPSLKISSSLLQFHDLYTCVCTHAMQHTCTQIHMQHTCMTHTRNIHAHTQCNIHDNRYIHIHTHDTSRLRFSIWEGTWYLPSYIWLVLFNTVISPFTLFSANVTLSLFSSVKLHCVCVS